MNNNPILHTNDKNKDIYIEELKGSTDESFVDAQELDFDSVDMRVLSDSSIVNVPAHFRIYITDKGMLNVGIRLICDNSPETHGVVYLWDSDRATLEQIEVECYYNAVGVMQKKRLAGYVYNNLHIYAMQKVEPSQSEQKAQRIKKLASIQYTLNNFIKCVRDTRYKMITEVCFEEYRAKFHLENYTIDELDNEIRLMVDTEQLVNCSIRIGIAIDSSVDHDLIIVGALLQGISAKYGASVRAGKPTKELEKTKHKIGLLGTVKEKLKLGTQSSIKYQLIDRLLLKDDRAYKTERIDKVSLSSTKNNSISLVECKVIELAQAKLQVDRLEVGHCSDTNPKIYRHQE